MKVRVTMEFEVRDEARLWDWVLETEDIRGVPIEETGGIANAVTELALYPPSGGYLDGGVELASFRGEVTSE